VKNSKLFSCLIVVYVLSVQAMLTERAVSSISDQALTLSQILKPSDILLFSLENMHQKFCGMSQESKRALVKIMSTELLFLACVAIFLPGDIVKNHICYHMMDGNFTLDITQEKVNKLKAKIGKAAHEFYITPINQMFDVYHAIARNHLCDTKPIGLLYLASKENRENILKIKSSWYYSVPIIDEQTKQLLDNELDEELRQIYLQDQEVIVLPDVAEHLWVEDRLHQNLLIGVGSSLCLFGCTTGIGSLIGFLSGGGLIYACNPSFLITNIGCSGISCMMPSLCGTLCDLYANIRRVSF
jgi:hypothetical protein